MKLIVLAENSVLQGKNLLGEHGFCLYLEVDGKKVLFDLGYSGVFLKNAQKLGIDLLDIDYVIFSHGHYDHTWGLAEYIRLISSAAKMGIIAKRPTIVAHPDVFNEKFEEGFGEIGCNISLEKLKKIFDINLSKNPFNITDNLYFLGEIPRLNDFEICSPIGEVKQNGEFIQDYIREDSALVYKQNDEISIITGCSHSGICNIIDYSKKLFNAQKINTVLGGFHLINPSENLLAKTTEYLVGNNITSLYPCHCTDFQSKIALAEKLRLEGIGVGLSVEI